MRYLILFLIVFSINSFAKSCDLEISHQRLENKKEELVLSLLALAVSKTEYTACFRERKQSITLAREAREVEKGRLRLMWAGSAPIAEAKLRAVRIPVFKGLLGYRVLIIRSDDQARFSRVNSVEQLISFTAGVGETWADRAILEAANMPIVTSAYGPQLWPMLIKQRFDYMAFGIFEAWQHFPEQSNSLGVEKSLILHYPISFYFYVNKEDDQLHEILTRGMELAITDGSYDRMLFQSALMKKAVKSTKISSRHVLKLPNPNMPQDTPLHIEKFWMSPYELEKAVLSANAKQPKI